MNELTSIHEIDLGKIRGGTDNYARDYGQLMGGTVGAYVEHPFLTGLPGIGVLVALGFGLWAASQN